MAIDHAMINKRIVMDVLQQSGTKAMANDTKSCYDRILLIVAYLTVRKFEGSKIYYLNNITHDASCQDLLQGFLHLLWWG